MVLHLCVAFADTITRYNNGRVAQSVWSRKASVAPILKAYRMYDRIWIPLPLMVESYDMYLSSTTINREEIWWYFLHSARKYLLPYLPCLTNEFRF